MTVEFNRPTPKMRELIIVHMVFQLNNIFGIICNVIIPSCRCTDRSGAGFPEFTFPGEVPR